MKTENVTLLGWQERFGAEKTCLDQLVRYRWPDGFICPHCGHDQGYFTVDGILPMHGLHASGIDNDWDDFRGQQTAAGVISRPSCWEYIMGCQVNIFRNLNEFCYRFNRRRVLQELPLHLLNACVQHVPIRHAVLC